MQVEESFFLTFSGVIDWFGFAVIHIFGFILVPKEVVARSIFSVTFLLIVIYINIKE